MVGIIILNYNNPYVTIDCIDSIESINTYLYKIVVVDNASSDNSVDVLDDYFKRKNSSNYQQFGEDEDINHEIPLYSLVLAKKNTGYASGNNVGLVFVDKDESVDYILILNNDILFVDDMIPRLVTILEDTEDAAIVSPVLYKKGLREIDKNCARYNVSIAHLIKFNFLHYFVKGMSPNGEYYLDSEINGDIMPIELPSGSCMMLKKDFFRSIGWFDPNTFLYYEENILAKKIQKCNKRNYLALNCKCIHLGASSTEKEPSRFIYNAGRKSRSYYVYNYSGCSWLMKVLYYLSDKFDYTVYNIIHYLRK